MDHDVGHFGERDADGAGHLVRDLVGVDMRPYFRPPFGDYDSSVNADVVSVSPGRAGALPRAAGGCPPPCDAATPMAAVTMAIGAMTVRFIRGLHLKLGNWVMG